MTDSGRSIGEFDDATLIGRGGFGSVYRATDVDHGREVAIKVLNGTLGETERRRFDRERQTMGRLGGHTNIVPVHDSGYTDDGEAYIVMELATGGSLRDRLEADGPMPWPDAVAVMAAIASAAEAAHANGVLHRDIKPDNILIDSYGTPKLTDFGIATVASNATATTSTTTTLAHAAPEILEGAPASPAVDIYAIGSTLHMLLTGTPPFSSSGQQLVATLVARVATEPPPDVRLSGVPDPVAAVVERALAKRPEDRQQTAAQLAEELRAAAADALDPSAAGVLARPSGAGPTVTVPGPAARPDVLVGSEQTDPIPSTPTVQTSASPVDEPKLDRSGRTLPVVAIVLVGIAALGLAALGLALALTGDSTGDDAASTTATPPPTVGLTTTTSTSTSTTATSTTATSTSTTTSSTTTAPTTTAAVIVERDLTATAVAFATSSAPSGNDACGDLTSFEPDNVLDGDPSTAWRTAGDGVGEVLQILLDGPRLVTSVGLLPGYAKVDPCDGVDRFSQNRRVILVRWTIGDETIEQRFAVDVPQLQTVRLPEPVAAEDVFVEIRDTTVDGGRDFTAVSEVQVLGG